MTAAATEPLKTPELRFGLDVMRAKMNGPARGVCTTPADHFTHAFREASVLPQSTSAFIPEQVPVVRRGVQLPGYFATRDGGICSFWIRVGSGRIRWQIGEVAKPLAASFSGKNGAYRGVALRCAGRTIRASVHVLIMESFCGPCPIGYEVCHGDGNGHNNRLDNLRYGTKASNEADKLRHGTHQYGEQNPSATLTDAQAEEIRQLRKAKVKLKVIAERFGVRESTVSRIANGVRRSR